VTRWNSKLKLLTVTKDKSQIKDTKSYDHIYQGNQAYVVIIFSNPFK